MVGHGAHAATNGRRERPNIAVAPTAESVINTFAPDHPDPELHELPGTCAHFGVDRDGTIYQLVPLTVMCRHTVGLNYVAIGIENVGTSDAEILHDRAQLRASLRLTAWLTGRFHIRIRNVIGHSESLTSPYHKELYASWRCQTHGDWTHSDMTTYRTRLAALARSERVTISRAGHPIRSPC